MPGSALAGPAPGSVRRARHSISFSSIRRGPQVTRPGVRPAERAYVGCCGQPGGESSQSSWRPYGVRISRCPASESCPRYAPVLTTSSGDNVFKSAEEQEAERREREAEQARAQAAGAERDRHSTAMLRSARRAHAQAVSWLARRE